MTLSQHLQRLGSPLALIAALLVIVALGSALGGDQTKVTLVEMLVRMTVVVGIYAFIGNSGIMSFGHISFMCIGAYAAAWATIDPAWKQVMLTGLPDFLQDAQYPFLVAVLGGALLAAVVSAILGAALMRLSGLAASIGTFAFLAIINSVYSNWETVTGGTSSVIGIPTVVDPWIALVFAAVTILVAYFFQNSRYGLMLRASRDDEVAAKSSSVRIIRVRLIAFVVSAFLVGMGGALYAHFLGVLTTDAFYLGMSFVTLSMLVIGGIGSLTGAVTGTVVVTVVIEVLRAAERGVTLGGSHLGLPQGSQEIGLGIVMALILVLRPTGLTRSRELPIPAIRAWLNKAISGSRRRTPMASPAGQE